MQEIEISESIKYIGASDKETKIFESQYHIPNGMAYNSYLIKDEKNVVMDTVDRHVTDKWVDNLVKELHGEELDYLVVSHLEPDHAYNIGLLVDKYPNMKIVGNAMTFRMLANFFNLDIEARKIEVKEGDTLNIGSHILQFFMAPMVHWPEVMVTYEKTEKVLFSADGFGKFGAIDTDEEWDDEARRYYFGIVGKYGEQVQALLKKASTLEINTICPLHGPILKENLEHYINKYDIWSRYDSEDHGVFIAVASIYGNTMEVAKNLAKMLEERGVKKVIITDLTKDDFAKAIENAFRYDKIILAASTYNMSVFPPMRQFLSNLKERNYQKRKIGIIENGSWAPSAGKCMRQILEEMKDIDLIEPIITIKSKMKEEDIAKLEKMADEIL